MKKQVIWGAQDFIRNSLAIIEQIMYELQSKIMNYEERGINDSLTDRLWKAADKTGYLQEGLNTKLIQGIKAGNLHPQIYGAFMVQDYAYQEEAAVLFEEAEKKAKQSGDNQLADYIAPFSTKYRKRSDTYFKQWGLKKNGINLSPACQTYLTLWRQAFQKYGPDYIFVLHFSCRMLWPWMADRIKDHIPRENNAYGFWIAQYETTKRETKMTQKIDEFCRLGRICPKKAWNLFQICLICEINFLKESFDEKFLPLVQMQ